MGCYCCRYDFIEGFPVCAIGFGDFYLLSLRGCKAYCHCYLRRARAKKCKKVQSKLSLLFEESTFYAPIVEPQLSTHLCAAVLWSAVGVWSIVALDYNAGGWVSLHFLGRSVCPVNYRGGRVSRLGCFAASSCRLPCCLAGMAGDAEDSVLIPCARTYPTKLFAQWPMLPSNPYPLHRLARIIALLRHLERKLLSRYAGSTNGKSFV